MKTLRMGRLSVLTLALLGSALGAAGTWAQSSSQAPVSLNFVNAEIEAVARTMASISGRNVVLDPRVKGQLSLATERPVSPAAALNQFAAALRLQGFALVDAAGLYKIVPEADAKLQGQLVIANGGPARAASNTVATQIFRLNHSSAAQMVPVLRPLIGPNNTINVNADTNALVITDYADNLQRLGRIIAALDVSEATDVEVIPLQHAVASDMVGLIQRLLDGGGNGPSGGPAPANAASQAGSIRAALVAEPRTNSLLLRAPNPARLSLVRNLVRQLDRPGSESASGNIHVVHLRNADATALATTLRAALSGQTDAGSAAPAASSGTGGNVRALVASSGANATGGQIQADAATNSLIISAPEPVYRQLRGVIDQLDTRRAQVYVESLIAEVNVDKLAEFGVQWQGPLGRSGDGVVGLLGTNFNTAGANIINLALGGGTVPPGTGLNVGLAQRNSGVYVLGFLARFLQENGSANILSTPTLLTLDNEEAKIVIGQNVPFVTGQFTNNNSNSGSVNPFQTIERKDVGLTLKVKPQISANGSIKLTIFQEVSRVLSTSPLGPSTNKRSIESTVIAEDGGIIVLGGLLQDEYDDSNDRVPGLASLPVFGNLFKSESRSRKKTNLMVFLRPVVLRDADTTERFSYDRYDGMRRTQESLQPTPSRVLQIDSAPMLPALPVLERREAGGLRPSLSIGQPPAQ